VVKKFLSDTRGMRGYNKMHGPLLTVEKGFQMANLFLPYGVHTLMLRHFPKNKQSLNVLLKCHHGHLFACVEY
jgi:hypothetical protein